VSEALRQVLKRVGVRVAEPVDAWRQEATRVDLASQCAGSESASETASWIEEAVVELLAGVAQRCGVAQILNDQKQQFCAHSSRRSECTPHVRERSCQNNERLFFFFLQCGAHDATSHTHRRGALCFEYTCSTHRHRSPLRPLRR